VHIPSSAGDAPARDVPALVGRWDAHDLSALVARRAAVRGDAALLGVYDRAERRFVTEAQSVVLARALATGEHLRAAGIGPGDPVVVALPGVAETWTVFLAALTIGALPVVHPARSAFGGGEDEDRLVGTLALLGPRARAVRATAHPDLAVVVLDGPIAAPSPADLGELIARRHRPDPDDVAYVQMTSGSTGLGRAVAVTHRSVFANVAALTARMAMEAGHGVSSWLPLHHDMGLVGMALLPLLQGNDCFLLAPFDFLADPAAWLRGFSDHGATMTASPDFGYAYAVRRVRDADLERLDLSSWRTACNGAEPVRLATMRAFTKRFAPCGFRPEVFTPCYGLAEATLAVTMQHDAVVPRFTRVEAAGLARLEPVTILGSGSLTDPEIPVPDDRAVLDAVAVGPPVDGVEVALVDGDGRPVTVDGVCGEVVVRGASVAAGYLRSGGTDVEPFPGDGLATGDVGFLLDGELHVVERLKNVIIRNGRNHSAQVLEQVLAEVTGVAVERVAVIEADLHDPASPIVAVVERDRETPSPEQLAASVSTHASRFELPLDAVAVVRRGAIPTTTSGKKRHAELRARWSEGRVDVLARVELHGETAEVEIDLTAGVAERVVAAVSAQARVRGRRGPVGPASRLREDLDLDSADLFEVALALEERLSVPIPEAALQGVTTVADLVAAIELVVDGDVAPAATSLARRREEVLEAIPQLVSTVSEQRGRRVRIEGRWVVDMASCNYLGLDLHPDVVAAVHPALERWGVHPSWTRAVASPEPYAQLEERLAALVGVPDVVVYPTVTLAHLGVLPPLTGPDGVLLVDEEAHHSLQEAATLARARGAHVVTVPHGDLDALDARLSRSRSRARRVIAIDGVYSMSGEVPDLAGYVDLARRHDAVVYVDDAHGFGVIGHDPTGDRPYGHAGDGVVRHRGLGYDHVVYVSGLSKAYSSMAAFVSCTGGVSRRFLATTSTQVFSGPIPVASLASALAGLDVNAAEGDRLRDRLHGLTRRLVDGVVALGLRVRNEGAFPIVFVELGTTDVVTAACRSLWDDGVLLTPSLFPAVPLDRGGVRFTVTAANDDDDIATVLAGLERVRDTLAVTVER
jgi:acyl carrier protein